MAIDWTRLRGRLIEGVLIFAVCMVLVKPLLGLLWQAVLWIGLHTYSGFIDHVYSRASAPQGSDIGLVLVALGMVLWAVDAHTRLIMGMIDRVAEDRLWKNIRKVRRAILVSVLVLMFMGVFEAVPQTIRQRFDRRASILLPYITDQEHRQWMRDWASIKTRADYVKLNDRLDSLAASKGVKLPPRRW